MKVITMQVLDMWQYITTLSIIIGLIVIELCSSGDKHQYLMLQKTFYSRQPSDNWQKIKKRSVYPSSEGDLWQDSTSLLTILRKYLSWIHIGLTSCWLPSMRCYGLLLTLNRDKTGDCSLMGINCAFSLFCHF